MILHGVGLNFGIDSTIINVNGAFQTREHHYEVDKREIKDGGETVVSLAYSNPREEATFSYIAIQLFATPFGNAFVSIPVIGSRIQIIDQRYPRIAGFWVCDDIQLNNSNITAVKVSLRLSRYPYVVPLSVINFYPPNR